MLWLHDPQLCCHSALRRHRSFGLEALESNCANQIGDDGYEMTDCEDPDCNGKSCNMIWGMCDGGLCVN